MFALDEDQLKNFDIRKAKEFKELFASRYSDEELRSWAKRIKSLLSSGKTVYIYFNNTLNGYAVENARTIRALIEK